MPCVNSTGTSPGDGEAEAGISGDVLLYVVYTVSSNDGVLMDSSRGDGPLLRDMRALLWSLWNEGLQVLDH